MAHCPTCNSRNIPFGAKRCPKCTSWIEGGAIEMASEGSSYKEEPLGPWTLFFVSYAGYAICLAFMMLFMELTSPPEWAAGLLIVPIVVIIYSFVMRLTRGRYDRVADERYRFYSYLSIISPVPMLFVFIFLSAF